MVRTTLLLDESLWKRAKIVTIEERTSLQELITKSLEAYLTQREKRKRKA